MYRYGLLSICLLALTMANAQYTHDSLKTADGYIHYYTKGKGKPVVLLPGGPGYFSYFKALRESLTD